MPLMSMGSWTCVRYASSMDVHAISSSYRWMSSNTAMTFVRRRRCATWTTTTTRKTLEVFFFIFFHGSDCHVSAHRQRRRRRGRRAREHTGSVPRRDGRGAVGDRTRRAQEVFLDAAENHDATRKKRQTKRADGGTDGARGRNARGKEERKIKKNQSGIEYCFFLKHRLLTLIRDGNARTGVYFIIIIAAAYAYYARARAHGALLLLLLLLLS